MKGDFIVFKIILPCFLPVDEYHDLICHAGSFYHFHTCLYRNTLAVNVKIDIHLVLACQQSLLQCRDLQILGHSGPPLHIVIKDLIICHVGDKSCSCRSSCNAFVMHQYKGPVPCHPYIKLHHVRARFDCGLDHRNGVFRKICINSGSCLGTMGYDIDLLAWNICRLFFYDGIKPVQQSLTRCIVTGC